MNAHASYPPSRSLAFSPGRPPAPEYMRTTWPLGLQCHSVRGGQGSTHIDPGFRAGWGPRAIETEHGPAGAVEVEMGRRAGARASTQPKAGARVTPADASASVSRGLPIAYTLSNGWLARLIPISRLVHHIACTTQGVSEAHQGSPGPFSQPASQPPTSPASDHRPNRSIGRSASARPPRISPSPPSMAAATMYALLPGTPVTAPASPATPPPATTDGPQLGGKWADAPPVAVTPYEKVLARLVLSLRSTLQSRWVLVGCLFGCLRLGRAASTRGFD